MDNNPHNLDILKVEMCSDLNKKYEDCLNSYYKSRKASQFKKCKKIGVKLKSCFLHKGS